MNELFLILLASSVFGSLRWHHADLQTGCHRVALYTEKPEVWIILLQEIAYNLAQQ